MNLYSKFVLFLESLLKINPVWDTLFEKLKKRDLEIHFWDENKKLLKIIKNFLKIHKKLLKIWQFFDSKNNVEQFRIWKKL